MSEKKVLLSEITPHWKIRLLILMFSSENAEKIIKLRWSKGRIVSQNRYEFCFRSTGMKDVGELEFYGTE